MRIGFFLDIYEPYISGVVESVKTLKKALELKGHKVYIITTNSNSKIKKYIREKNIILIPSTKTNINDFSLRFTYPKKCEKIIERLNLDIIHSHTEFTIGKFGKHMAKKLNIPFIQTFHTLYEPALNYVTKGHFNKLTEKFISKILSSYYNDKVINNIIVPTDEIKSLLINKYNITNSIDVVPSSIDIDKFKRYKDVDKLRESLNLNKDDFILLWVGRIGYEKNIEFLIESQYKLFKINPNIKLLLVGIGPLKEALEEEVISNHMENNILFLGHIKNDELSTYYHMANINVNASFNETQGLTILESLASNTPVICYRSNVFKTVIKDNYNGYLFKNKNEYIKKVLYLYHNKDKYNTIKNNTIESINNYSLEVFSNKVLSIYNKYLN